MRNTIFATTLATLAAGTAIAGSPITPVPTIAPLSIASAPAAITDWSGLYAGGMYSFFTGQIDYFTGGVDDGNYDMEGDAFGVFAGYNFQNGSMVYGGELAYSIATVGELSEGDFYPDYGFEYFLDAKARVGYVLGNALLYGSLGWTFSEWNEGPFSAPSDGFNAGVGVDYLVTETIFLGAEYVFRNQTSQWTADPTQTNDIDLHALQLRVGMTF